MLAPWPYLVQQLDRLVQGHGLGRAAFLAFGDDDQAGDVAADLVPGLGVPDGAFQDLVDKPQGPVRQLSRPLIHPPIQLVGGQLLEPGRAFAVAEPCRAYDAVTAADSWPQVFAFFAQHIRDAPSRG